MISSISGSSRKRRRGHGSSSVAGSDFTNLACKRCRSRKVGCDTTLPRCSPCSRAGAPCIVADSTTTREYTRLEARQLQERLQYLQRLLAMQSPMTHEPSSEDPATQESQPQSQVTGQSPSRYVGREVGVEFLQNMLEAIRKPSPAALRHLLAPQQPTSSIVYHDPHPHPPRADASRIVAHYLGDFHVEHPFLDPCRVSDVFCRLYGEIEKHDALDGAHRVSKEDRFQTNMILAIGSIGLYRSGNLNLDPFGFFTAALEASPPFGFSFGSVQDVENILLIAHFGVFYNIGCSIWELSRICIRICIELQLHQTPDGSAGISMEEEQRQRRVFWESYCLDRFSSSTLGRPFAINDAIITVEYPECAPVATGRRLEFWSPTAYDQPDYDRAMDRRVFNHLLKLSRITSQLHYFHQLQRTVVQDRGTQGYPHSTLGAREGYGQLRQLAAQLLEWRQSIPVFDEPTCSSQAKGNFELCFYKENLYLIRIAIDLSSARNAHPPMYLLGPCLRSACNLILTFDDLRRRRLVPYTRAHTHLIFMTSLIIVFMTFAQAQNQHHQRGATKGSPSLVDVESWWANLLDGADDHPTQDERLHALSVSADVLNWLASHMPDMQSYANCLIVLRRELEREISKASASDATRSQQHLLPEHTAQPNANNRDALAGAEQNTEGGTFVTLAQPDYQSLPDYVDQTFGDPNSLGAPENAMEGILSNFFPTMENPTDVDAFQPTYASWPFSQIPWFESIYSELSGYDEDMPIS